VQRRRKQPPSPAAVPGASPSPAGRPRRAGAEAPPSLVRRPGAAALPGEGSPVASVPWPLGLRPWPPSPVSGAVYLGQAVAKAECRLSVASEYR